MSNLVFKGNTLKSIIAKAKDVFFDRSRTNLSSTNMEDVLNELGALYDNDDAIIRKSFGPNGEIMLKCKNGKIVLIYPKQSSGIFLNAYYLHCIYSYNDNDFPLDLTKPMARIATVNTAGNNGYYWLDLITQGYPAGDQPEALACNLCSIHGYLGASDVDDPTSAIFIGQSK